MSELTVQDGKLVLRNGGIGTAQACCCKGDSESGACCLNDGTCTTEYQTREQCEECITTYTCFDFVTSEQTPVQSCDECIGETKFCSSSTEGPCGSFVAGSSCENSPCCSSTGDCPETDPNCPDVPMACCDNTCQPWSCYPGLWIKLDFIKPAGCQFAALENVAEGDPFSVVIASTGLVCEESADLTSGPCDTQWRVSRGCLLSNFSFNATVGFPPESPCPSCYSDFQGFTWGRQNPEGTLPPGSWEPC